MEKLYILVNNKLVDLSHFNDFLKQNVENWILDIYLYLKEQNGTKNTKPH